MRKCFPLLITTCLLAVLPLLPLFSYGEIRPVELNYREGRLVNNGPNRSLKNYRGLENLRYYEDGLRTRFGTANYTTDAEPSGNSIYKIATFDHNSAFNLLAFSQDQGAGGTSLFNISDYSFGSGTGSTLYWTSGANSTEITTATVRDSFLWGDSSGVYIWGGVSTFPTALIVEYSDDVFTDESDHIYNGETLALSSGVTFHVGYSRPFDAIQMDLDSDTWDTSFSSDVTEYWRGGIMAYWATVEVASGGSTVELPKIKTTPRLLGTHWDGRDWMYSAGALFWKTGTSPFENYTASVNNSSNVSYMDVQGWESGGTIAFGFPYRPRLIQVYVDEDFKNTSSSYSTFGYWNGETFTNFSGTTIDGTRDSENNAVFGQTGELEFPKVLDWKKRAYGETDLRLYWFVWNIHGSGISGFARPYQIIAIPETSNPNDHGFKSVGRIGERVIIYNGDRKNQYVLSAKRQPDVYAGEDAISVDDYWFIGKEEETIAISPILSGSVIFKKTETFYIEDVPLNPLENIQAVVIPDAVSCVSTYGPAVIQVDEQTAFGRVRKHYIMYPTADGVYALTTNGENPKKSLDINAYWEEGNPLQFSSTDLSNSVGWYDRVNNEYRLLVGSTQLVFHIASERWTTFSINNAIAINTAMFDKDNNGNVIHLGGGSGGTIFQLESGASDYGNSIISAVTKSAVQFSAGKSEIRKIGLRYDLPGGSISGATFYLTNDNDSTYETSIDLSGDYVDFVPGGGDEYRKSRTHGIAYRVPGRIDLFQEFMEVAPLDSWPYPMSQGAPRRENAQGR